MPVMLSPELRLINKTSSEVTSLIFELERTSKIYNYIGKFLGYISVVLTIYITTGDSQNILNDIKLYQLMSFLIILIISTDKYFDPLAKSTDIDRVVIKCRDLLVDLDTIKLDAVKNIGRDSTHLEDAMNRFSRLRRELNSYGLDSHIERTYSKTMLEFQVQQTALNLTTNNEHNVV